MLWCVSISVLLWWLRSVSALLVGCVIKFNVGLCYPPLPLFPLKFSSPIRRWVAICGAWMTPASRKISCVPWALDSTLLPSLVHVPLSGPSCGGRHRRSVQETSRDTTESLSLITEMRQQILDDIVADGHVGSVRHHNQTTCLPIQYESRSIQAVQ